MPPILASLTLNGAGKGNSVADDPRSGYPWANIGICGRLQPRLLKSQRESAVFLRVAHSLPRIRAFSWLPLAPAH